MTFFHGSIITYLVVTVANFTTFLSGAIMGWSSPVIAILEGNNIDEIPLGRKITQTEESWIGSLTALGGVFGPFIFGCVVQRFGRKIALGVLALPFLTAFLIAAFAKVVALFYVSRILMGIGVGGTFYTVPVYVAQIAENTNRGLLIASIVIAANSGTLFSSVVGSYTSIMEFNLILSAICIIYIPALWYVACENPYYLVSNKNENEALKALCYLRQKSNDEVQKELNEIKFQLNGFKPGSFLDIFKTKVSLKALGYVVTLTTFSQLSGQTVIMYYTQNIFNATGSDMSPQINSIIVSSVQVVASLISSPFLDKVGRKILLIFTVNVAIIGHVVLGAYFYLEENGKDVSDIGWLPVFSLGIFIISFNFGIGSIPWLAVSEMFPLNVVSKATVLVTTFFLLSGFLLTKYFGAMSSAIGMGGSFWLFAGFCLLSNLFNIFFMIETKGKSFSEIQTILSQ